MYYKLFVCACDAVAVCGTGSAPDPRHRCGRDSSGRGQTHHRHSIGCYSMNEQGCGEKQEEKPVSHHQGVESGMLVTGDEKVSREPGRGREVGR